VIVHPPTLAAEEQELPEEEEDVDVAETIVLPSKNTADRLDFTKHWLAGGDVRSWAESSPRRADKLLGHQQQQQKGGNGKMVEVSVFLKYRYYFII
jgi:hypothetical protein